MMYNTLPAARGLDTASSVTPRHLSTAGLLSANALNRLLELGAIDDRVRVRLAELLAREHVHRIMHPGNDAAIADLPREVHQRLFPVWKDLGQEPRINHGADRMSA